MEVLECIHHMNRSVFGVPAFTSFICAHVTDIIQGMYYNILFYDRFIIKRSYTIEVLYLLMRFLNVLLLFGICHATENEVRFNVFIYIFIFHKNCVRYSFKNVNMKLKFLKNYHTDYIYLLYTGKSCGSNLTRTVFNRNKPQSSTAGIFGYFYTYNIHITIFIHYTYYNILYYYRILYFFSDKIFHASENTRRFSFQTMRILYSQLQTIIYFTQQNICFLNNPNAIQTGSKKLTINP